MKTCCMCTVSYGEKHTLKLDCILHTHKRWHSKDVSRIRDKRIDVLSFPFHQLKLLPTRVHHSVTDCHILQHVYSSVRTF